MERHIPPGVIVNYLYQTQDTMYVSFVTLQRGAQMISSWPASTQAKPRNERTNLVRLESIKKLLDIGLFKTNHPTTVKHTTTKRQPVNLDVLLPARLEHFEDLFMLLFALALDIRRRFGFGNYALWRRWRRVDGRWRAAR